MGLHEVWIERSLIFKYDRMEEPFVVTGPSL